MDKFYSEHSLDAPYQNTNGSEKQNSSQKRKRSGEIESCYLKKTKNILPFQSFANSQSDQSFDINLLNADNSSMNQHQASLIFQSRVEQHANYPYTNIINHPYVSDFQTNSVVDADQQYKQYYMPVQNQGPVLKQQQKYLDGSNYMHQQHNTPTKNNVATYQQQDVATYTNYNYQPSVADNPMTQQQNFQGNVHNNLNNSLHTRSIQSSMSNLLTTQQTPKRYEVRNINILQNRMHHSFANNTDTVDNKNYFAHSMLSNKTEENFSREDNFQNFNPSVSENQSLNEPMHHQASMPVEACSNMQKSKSVLQSTSIDSSQQSITSCDSYEVPSLTSIKQIRLSSAKMIIFENNLSIELGNDFGQHYNTGRIIYKDDVREIFTGTHITQGVKVTVKRVELGLNALMAKHCNKLIPLEILMHWKAMHDENKNLESKGVVEMYDYFVNDFDHYTIVTEEGKGFYTLRECVEKYGVLSENTAKSIFFQLWSTLRNIHQRKVVLRNISFENILINPRTKEAKFSNFDCATHYRVRAKTQYGPLGSSAVHSHCGLENCQLPELLNGNKIFEPDLDRWNMGLILYFMIEGKPAFKSRGEVLSKEPEVSEGSRNFEYFIRKLLSKDRKNRLKFGDVKAHPWLKEN